MKEKLIKIFNWFSGLFSRELTENEKEFFNNLTDFENRIF
jgi:hypothetical protein